jgi:signal transduction histidine kinase
MQGLILCTDTDYTNNSLFDFSIAPDLLLYSYIPIAILALVFGLLIRFSKGSQFKIPSILFFLLSIAFALHIINELLQWVIVPAGLMYFGWGIALLLHAIIAFLLFFFTLNYVNQKPTPFILNTIGVVLALPVILLLPTELSMLGFDPDWCGAIDGPLWRYVYILEALVALSFLVLGAKSYIKLIKFKDTKYKKEALLFLGSFLFTAIFFGSEFLGSITYIFEINFVGPLGMLIFIAILTLMIIKYRAFNIKLLGAQALMLGIVMLVGSQLFFVKNVTNQVLVVLTFLFSVLGGISLVRSVKNEVKQREKIEKLALNLEKANARLEGLDKQKSEFVSIASHQLRSPLTAIRGYASMLAEGSFGKLPEKAQESAERISESAKLMAMSIEDFLNVSRIESGNMKYNLSDFNLKDQVDHICDDLRPEAMKQGLILLFRSDLKSRAIISADIGKVVQIIHNLINNSIKYTKKGSISVFMRDDIKLKRIYIDIIDTGVGMSEATIDKLFNKFSRADNANAVNVSGTGLGLFVALKMAEAMGGNISAHSEGDAKGSRFTIEMPLSM